MSAHPCHARAVSQARTAGTAWYPLSAGAAHPAASRQQAPQHAPCVSPARPLLRPKLRLTRRPADAQHGGFALLDNFHSGSAVAAGCVVHACWLASIIVTNMLSIHPSAALLESTPAAMVHSSAMTARQTHSRTPGAPRRGEQLGAVGHAVGTRSMFQASGRVCRRFRALRTPAQSANPT